MRRFRKLASIVWLYRFFRRIQSQASGFWENFSLKSPLSARLASRKIQVCGVITHFYGILEPLQPDRVPSADRDALTARLAFKSPSDASMPSSSCIPALNDDARSEWPAENRENNFRTWKFRVIAIIRSSDNCHSRPKYPPPAHKTRISHCCWRGF